MKILLHLFLVMLLATQANAQNLNGSEEDRKSLDKATEAIRDAFAKGDAALIARLHHPNVVKYFGGNNVVTGRANLERGLANWFQTTRVAFIGIKVESTVFYGETAIQTVIFTMENMPKAGGKPTINRGRSMVVYVRDKTSPTGWLSIREMTQEAPEKTH